MVLSSFSACIMIGDGVIEEEESNENAETDETENTEDETSESDDAQKEEETPKLVLPAVLVADAVNFECDIISDYGWGSSFQNHFVIPKLNFETENSKAFNDKIYKDFSKTYILFKNYMQNGIVPNAISSDTIYTIGYTYKAYGNIVGVVVSENRMGVGTDGIGGNIIKAYYYDCNNDKELTFDEYLNSFGYTKEEAQKLFVTMKDKDSDDHKFVKTDSVLEMCLIDSKSTRVYFSNLNSKAFNDMEFMPGSDTIWSYEVNPIVEAEMPKKLTAEETAAYWEKYYNENKGDLLSVTKGYIEEYAQKNDEGYLVNLMTDCVGGFIMDYDNDETPELCVSTKIQGYAYADRVIAILKLNYETVTCIDILKPDDGFMAATYKHNIYIDSDGSKTDVSVYEDGYGTESFEVSKNGKVIRNLEVDGEWLGIGTDMEAVDYTITSTEFDEIVVKGKSEADKITAPHWEWLEKLSESFIDFKNVGFLDVWNKQCDLRK